MRDKFYGEAFLPTPICELPRKDLFQIGLKVILSLGITSYNSIFISLIYNIDTRWLFLATIVFDESVKICIELLLKEKT